MWIHEQTAEKKTFHAAARNVTNETAYVFQEAAADLADVGLLLVELLLQPFQELPLEAVDLLDVAEDGAQLLFREHVRPLAALLDVTLGKKKKKNT